LAEERISGQTGCVNPRAEFDFKEIINMQDEFEFEYAMSQSFSKKQKELGRIW